MDHNTVLCLACSSSLPPVKSSSKGSTRIFTTPCCSRPICPACLTSNPRLARYDPCLACLSGVGAISPRNATGQQGIPKNVDGAVKDEDTFILGDDDEEGPSEDEDAVPHTPPPDYAESTTTPVIPELANTKARATPEHDHTVPNPSEYYIKPGDTLQGIALRFGVNGRELCRLNKLPPSTLSTTPHILHTRASIIIPPSAQSRVTLNQDANEADKEREARRARERAEKRLQTLTKEVDWRVAKAYVALCDDPNEATEYGIKHKEMGNNTGQASLEEIATELYLEDEEWERRETKAGRGLHLGAQRLSTSASSSKLR